jgi:hypothetical protein
MAAFLIKTVMTGDNKMKDISKVTLYSGGHRGAEAEFGRLAQAWNLMSYLFL